MGPPGISAVDCRGRKICGTVSEEPGRVASDPGCQKMSLLGVLFPIGSWAGWVAPGHRVPCQGTGRGSTFVRTGVGRPDPAGQRGGDGWWVGGTLA